jgi:hypothetical protein
LKPIIKIITKIDLLIIPKTRLKRESAAATKIINAGIQVSQNNSSPFIKVISSSILFFVNC